MELIPENPLGSRRSGNDGDLHWEVDRREKSLLTGFSGLEGGRKSGEESLIYINQEETRKCQARGKVINNCYSCTHS